MYAITGDAVVVMWLIQTWTILPCFRGQKTTAVVMELRDQNVPGNRANQGELFQMFSIWRWRSKCCATRGSSKADYQRENVTPVLWKCCNSGTNTLNNFWHGKVWGAIGAGWKCSHFLTTLHPVLHSISYGDTPGPNFNVNTVSKCTGIATRWCSMPAGSTSLLNHCHPGGGHHHHHHHHHHSLNQHHPNQ